MNYVSCEPYSLYDILVSSTFLVQVTRKENGILSDPVTYGSGFIVDRDGSKYFVTADHVLNVDEYEDESVADSKNKYDVSLFNNYTPPDEMLSSAITPLSPFHFMREFNPINPGAEVAKVDICICKMSEVHYKYPMLTEQILLFDNFIVPGGKRRYELKPVLFGQPNTKDEYAVFGTVRLKLKDDIRLNRQNSLILGLRYIMYVKGYLLFQAPEVIVDADDWRGLSGAPIFSSDGHHCVGVFCSVNQDSTMIFAIPISTVSILIDSIDRLKR